MAVMSITFGGVNSADYGIYIGGEGTFNAPERDVEVVSVPGRNGNLIIDNGRFQNIEVKYSAINQEPDLATFAANLEAFRNAIASQKGYQRLTDTFHPDEYRMATFRSGLEINPIEYNTASEFEIVFDCKPQRFLTSGEILSVLVANPYTFTNPTPFEASPLLEIYGYGDIDIDGQVITINNQPIGTVLLKNKQKNAYYITEIDTASLAAGDTITIDSLTFYIWFTDTAKITGCGAHWDYDLNMDPISSSSKKWGYRTVWETIPALTKGTSFSQSWNVYPSFEDATGNYEYQFRFTLTYDGDNEIRLSYSTVSYTHTGTKSVSVNLSRDIGAIYGESTLSTLGNPIYCDLDIGEAYKYVGEELVSVNSGVIFPAALPTLKPGPNVISRDDTIDSFGIIPRWYKI